MSFDAVGIVAENPEKSVAFYALLGVKFAKAGGAEHYEAATPSGVRLMLDSVALIRSFDPEWQKPTGCGVVMCFKQASAADVDRVYSSLVDAGPGLVDRVLRGVHREHSNDASRIQGVLR